jgi:hypothetical protein
MFPVSNWLMVFLMFQVPQGKPAKAAAPIITPGAPATVYQGQTYKFTANIPVIWSLAPGSQGTIDPDGTYHAPAKINSPSLAGCPAYPQNNVFNTRIDNLPKAANNDQVIGFIQSHGNNGKRLLFSPTMVIPTYIDANTPNRGLTFTYSPAANGMYPWPLYPLPYWESGYWSGMTTPATVFDNHVFEINHDTCNVYEFYSPWPQVQDGITGAQGGAAVDLTKNDYPNGGIDVAGQVLSPVTFRAD